MKRLLIVTTNFPPSRSIGTQRILRIGKFLDRTNWQISVLTLKEKYYPEFDGGAADLPDYLRDVRVTRTGKLDWVHFLLNLRRVVQKDALQKSGGGGANHPGGKNGRISADHLQNVGYNPAEMLAKRSWWQVIKDFVTDLGQFPDKHITWLPLAVWRGYRLIKKQKIDVIFSSSPPHSLHLMTALLKKLTGVRLIIDFRDPWARSPWHDSERTANRFEKWKHHKIVDLERWVINQADRVILITEEMRQDFVRNYPDIPAEKFHLFNNGFDPENLPENLNGAIKIEEQRDRVRFIHAGSLYKHRDPLPILQALQNLLESGRIPREKIEFLFVGAVTEHQQHTKALSHQMGLDDVVRYISKVSYHKSLEYMANSDVLILLQPVTKLQLPGKFYDYICWDKPILAVAEEDSATKNIVNDRFGLFVNFNDVHDIERGIAFLYENPRYLVDKIRENRHAFNMSNAIRKFDEIIAVS